MWVLVARLIEEACRAVRTALSRMSESRGKSWGDGCWVNCSLGKPKDMNPGKRLGVMVSAPIIPGVGVEGRNPGMLAGKPV